MAYNKNDIVQFIQDSKGYTPATAEDIAAIIKTQVAMGDADAYIKSLNEDNREIKVLLEQVLAGNIGTVSTDRSFKDALTEQVKDNKNFMVVSLGYMKDMAKNISFGVEGKIDTVLGEEKTNLIDPVVGIGRGIGDIANRFRANEDVSVGIAQESKESLDNIYDVNKEQLDLVKESKKSLDNIYSTQQDQLDLTKETALRDQRAMDKKEDSAIVAFLKRLAMIGVIGASLGALIGSLVLPFKVMMDSARALAGWLGYTAAAAEKTAGVMTKISDLGKKVPVLKHMFFFFEKLGKLQAKFSRWIGIVKSIVNMDDLTMVFKSMGRWITSLVTTSEAVGDAVDTASDLTRALEKFPRLANMVNKVVDVFTRIGNGLKIFLKGEGALAGIMKPLSKGAAFLMRAVGAMKSLLTPIGMFFKAFAFGMKYLAWPLTILIGAIDFFKGFIGSSEETFLGKIKDGIISVITSFFEMPLRILGWIYDKAMTFIGIESSGSGQKMVEALGGALQAIFGPIVKVLNFIVKALIIPAKILITTIRSTFKFIFSVLGGAIKAVWAPIRLIIATVIEVFRAVKNMVFGMAKSIIAVISTVISVVGKIVSAIWKFLTFDFEGAMGDLGGIKEIIKAGFDTFISGIMEILDAPVELLRSVGSHIMTAVTNFIDGLLNMILAPFWFMKNQITGIYSHLENIVAGTFLEPIIELFMKIGGIVNKVIDWVGNKMSKIPIIGKLFTKDKPEQKITKASIESFRSDIRTPSSGFLGGAVVAAKTTTGMGRGDYIPHQPMVSPSMSTMSSASYAKANAMSRQSEQMMATTKAVNQLNKDARQQSERPIIVNTGSPEKRIIEPPEDIEAMSILFLNKSWGLG